jgi:hypothetical protein
VKLQYSLKNILRGALIYVYGDTIASLILHQFLWTRMFGIMLVGATFYAIEIPIYFKWIDLKTKDLAGIKQSLAKTGLAILYFNPVWIARHLLFIKLFSLQFSEITWDILRIASWSFLVNIPISIIANYIIQNRITPNWRFFASAVFSATLAVYYAMSVVIF